MYTQCICIKNTCAQTSTQKHKNKIFQLPIHMRVKVISLGVYPVARPVVLCAGTPSEELLHAVKQTVVSV